jgi:hypothetical protein
MTDAENDKVALSLFEKFDVPDDPDDLIREINPDMSLDEAVWRVQLYNQRVTDGTNTAVFEAIKKMLTDFDYNPEEWVYFSNMQSPEEAEKHFAEHFPRGVDYLALPGQYIGGITGGAVSFGLAKHTYHNNGYTTFIRVRPK